MDSGGVIEAPHTSYNASETMVFDRYSGPTTYSSKPLPLTAPNYSRPPLADTSGNNHYKPIILPNISQRSRPAYSSRDYSPPKYKPPTVPSQRSDLQRRRTYLRDARFDQGPRDSGDGRGNSQDQRPSNETLKRLIKTHSEYKAYRAKADKQDNGVWPVELEEHFLDALLLVPTMGRVKWSLDNKAAKWGRNMIIHRYLCIAYFDKHGNRTKAQQNKARKQVSSHIQVIKQKLGHEPWFQWVIPTTKKTETKEAKDAVSSQIKAKLAMDPCIAALARGTLPNATQHAIRPWSFDLWMSTPSGACYNFTQPGNLVYEPEDCSDDNSASLRQRFPQLRQARAADCDIIRIKACLNLHDPISEAELHGIFKISVPADETHLDWRCSVSFKKHKDLCGPPEDDVPIANYLVAMKPLNDKTEDSTSCLMRVHFPAVAWAHALSKLSSMHESWKEGRSEGQPSMSAREYLEQMTMCQEISSSTGNDHWETRAIFAWTFTKTRGTDAANTWCYATVNPLRSDVFEPHPGKQHEVQAIMADNFNSLYQPQPSSLSIQPVQFDCLSYGPTPPLTATSQSPYTHYQQSYNSQNDLVADDGSYMTQSSADVLQGQHGASQLDHYLPTDEALSMSFDQMSQQWQTSNQATTYDAMSNFLPPLNMLPPIDNSVGQAWNGDDGLKQSQQWTGHENTYDYDLHAYGQAREMRA